MEREGETVPSSESMANVTLVPVPRPMRRASAMTQTRIHPRLVLQLHLMSYSSMTLSSHRLVGLAPSGPSPDYGGMVLRSDDRRVGKEWVGTCKSRWSPEQ